MKKTETSFLSFFRKQANKIQANDLPNTPYKISPGVTITDNKKMIERLKIDLCCQSRWVRSSAINTLIKISIMTKNFSLEKMIIIKSYKDYSVMNKLSLKHEEVFDFLLMTDVFKPKDEPWCEGKTWGDFYESTREDAVKRAVEEKSFDFSELNSVLSGDHPVVDRWIKVICCELFFQRTNDEKIATMLNINVKFHKWG